MAVRQQGGAGKSTAAAGKGHRYMATILIVDDEEWIRDSIRLKLMRSGLPIDNIYDCASSEDALALLEGTSADIAICDIRMSGIDGLTLCSLLSLRYPQMQKIIVSGHSEFDYAVKAIQEGVVSYLLKPIDNVGLCNAVKNCIERMKNDPSAEIRMVSMREAVYENSENPAAGLAPNTIRHLMKSATPASFFGFCHIYTGEKNNISLSDMLSLVMRCAAGFAFGEDMFFFKGEPMEYTAVFCFPPATGARWMPKLQKIAGDLIDELAGRGSFEATCGLEGAAMPLGPAYERAKSNMRYRIFLPEERIIRTEMAARFRDEYKINRQLMVRLRHALERGRYRELSEVLGQISDEISSMNISYASLDLLYGTLLGFAEDTGSAYASPPKPLWRYSSARGMINAVKELYLSRINVTFLQEENAKTHIANRVQDYLNNHYDENISLEQLAESHYITPAYLSFLFKDIFGINFLDYLQNIRLENAKSLLKTGSYKIKTVAEMTGFNDQHYFSRVFKKLTGISPREYVEKERTNNSNNNPHF